MRLAPALLPIPAVIVCAACAPASRTLNEAEWIRRPTPSEIARAVDSHVRAVGFVGQAVLRCTVQPDGTLAGCTVVSESHPGLGLGEAALSLSRFFRAGPGVAPKESVEAVVRMPARALITPPGRTARATG